MRDLCLIRFLTKHLRLEFLFLDLIRFGAFIVAVICEKVKFDPLFCKIKAVKEMSFENRSALKRILQNGAAFATPFEKLI